jgi:hypothetical protein
VRLLTASPRRHPGLGTGRIHRPHGGADRHQELQHMTINYIKVYRNDDGEVTHEQDADGEIRSMNRQIEMLKTALEIQMQAVADLRELLNAVRKIAYDATEQTLKAKL